jgi:hypothetical protein
MKRAISFALFFKLGIYTEIGKWYNVREKLVFSGMGQTSKYAPSGRELAA